MTTQFRRSPTLTVDLHGGDVALVDRISARRYPVEPAILATLARLTTWTDAADLSSGEHPLDERVASDLCVLGVLERRPACAGPHPADLDLLGCRVRTPSGPVPAPSLAAGRPLPPVLPPPRHLPATTLEDVLHRRRSERDFAPAPIRAADLADLLFHSARRTRLDAGADAYHHPYPGAGGLGELDVHVVTYDVEGFPRAAHHYDAVHHRLDAAADAGSPRIEELRVHVTEALARPGSAGPQAVVLIGADLERITGRYGRLGALLVQQNAGGLLQTFALVATALGLASCPIGTGLPPSGWLGTDVVARTDVGAVAVGVARGLTAPVRSGG